MIYGQFLVITKNWKWDRGASTIFRTVNGTIINLANGVNINSGWGLYITDIILGACISIAKIYNPPGEYSNSVDIANKYNISLIVNKF